MSRADAQAAGERGRGGALLRLRLRLPLRLRPRLRLRLLGVGLLAGAGVLLGACGSPSASEVSGTLARSCQAVAAVLSDGPGPVVDPIGYAEAQIRPLRDVRTPDRSLHQDIQRLDRAYREVFDSNDSPASARAERSASGRLDAVCPKAAP